MKADKRALGARRNRPNRPPHGERPAPAYGFSTMSALRLEAMASSSSISFWGTLNLSRLAAALAPVPAQGVS